VTQLNPTIANCKLTQTPSSRRQGSPSNDAPGSMEPDTQAATFLTHML
jgi:hypothetical protein